MPDHVWTDALRGGPSGAGSAPGTHALRVPVESGLPGDLVVPAGAVGVTLFAHGTGSSRLSPRNRFVASELNARRIATFLFDLLTPEEEADRRNVFDIELLAERLLGATEWLLRHPAARGLEPCFFGASTGAAAALEAAARLGPGVRAVVARGGRPDLAAASLSRVASPTLLIVGGDDDVVLDLNRRALGALGCERRLVVVRTATHLFQEPGTLERVAVLAGDWIARHLGERRPGAAAHEELDVVDPVGVS